MFALLGLVVAGGTAAVGYLKSRSFVRRRLRFVDSVQKRSAPVVAGAVATVVAAPVAWLLPLVGTGTAMLFGLSVGIGVRAGARDIRKWLHG